MNNKEREILEHLKDAWNLFVSLNEKHPMDNEEFCKAIHDAQKMIALRVARRTNPEVWTITAN